jgi:hypothetical protein
MEEPLNTNQKVVGSSPTGCTTFMPCTYYETAQEIAAHNARYSSRLKRQGFNSAKKELDRLTRLLCSACDYIGLRTLDLNTTIDPELRDWYIDHRKRDQAKAANRKRKTK